MVNKKMRRITSVEYGTLTLSPIEGVTITTNKFGGIVVWQ